MIEKILILIVIMGVPAMMKDFIAALRRRSRQHE
jgi:hypothetical protein